MRITRTSAGASLFRRFSQGSSIVLSVSSLGKLQRVFALLLLGAVVLFGFVALYSEVVGRQRSRIYANANWGKPTLFKWVTRAKKQNYEENLESWKTSFTSQSWKPEYMGQANLHVFEDWCGSSTDDLRRNVHYPLHPHVRTTVKKLALTPQQTNYGLRIFGYLHPFTDGEFVFALSSDDNSEFWLSTDDSPLNLQLLAWVGKTGAEWTAPGEFDKFIHQISVPIRLSAQTKYFFEVIHKQNTKGLDHVAVAWRLWDQAQNFVIIQSDHISLYVGETGKVLGDITHIPQTVASHSQSNTEKPSSDMQREDPRDTFYHVPLISNTSLRGVLPDCPYKPSYTIKGYRLQRYQGLKFVHLSYVYPNDHTRLTHREPENACYYSIKHYYFYKYINMDIPGVEEKKDPVPLNSEHFDEGENQQGKAANLDIISDNTLFSQEADFVERFSVNRKRRILSVDNEQSEKNTNQQMNHGSEKVVKSQGAIKMVNPKAKLKQTKRLANRKQLGAKKPLDPSEQLGSKLLPIQRSPKIANAPQPVRFLSINDMLDHDASKKFGLRDVSFRSGNLDQLEADLSMRQWEKAMEENMPVPLDNEQMRKPKWSQTFKIKGVDYRAQKSHTLNMDCTMSGNILLQEAEVRPIVEGFMEKFNEKHSGLFTLERVINVEMNEDAQKGKRYLLELELKDETGMLLRLSHYIFALKSDNAEQEQPKLCNPVGFSWNPQTTVYFIIPVKNQAKWVHLLIEDIEKLVNESGDSNFNLILTDFNSTDMNIKQALEKSKIPRYQYKKLSGNFERSRGLQEGVNLINDPHSIVFLFDLHIRFPSSIIDTVRKHCIEGYQAFAPIVIRLECGATPSNARGFWEVQGFGLLGIYKSDLDAVGGMNTREFKDRWGGEDWELLDRILEEGLEVERIYLRNFYHHFHSKRGMWRANQD